MRNLSIDPKPIGLNLWSVMAHLRHDLRGTVDALAAMGIVAVEPSQYRGFTSAELRDAIAATDMVVCSAQGPIPVGPDADALIEERAAFGTDTYMCAGRAAPQFHDGPSLGRYIDALNEAAQNCARGGMTFGYHNHWYEFEPIDGAAAFDTLVEGLDPAIVLQIDTYWAQLGGVEAVDVLTRYCDRVHSMHLKDGPGKTSAKPTVPFGDGIMDLEGCVAAAPAAKWHIVELHNNNLDALGIAARCVDYLIDKGWSIPRAAAAGSG